MADTVGIDKVVALHWRVLGAGESGERGGRAIRGRVLRETEESWSLSVAFEQSGRQCVHLDVVTSVTAAHCCAQCAGLYWASSCRGYRPIYVYRRVSANFWPLKARASARW